MASIFDIEMTKNNDITIAWTVKDKFGNIINITDMLVIWEVKKSYLSTALITKQTGGHGITITNPTAGKFQIVLSAADTLHLDPGSYLHQATLTDNSGNSVSLTGLTGAPCVFQLLPQVAIQEA